MRLLCVAKLVVAVTVTLNAAASTDAGPLDSCADQAPCFDFTVKQENCDDDCQYKVCLKLNTNNPECHKSDSVSHTCEKDPNVCNPPPGFDSATETTSIKNGHTQCQQGKPGTTLEFLIKDGGKCNGGNYVVNHGPNEPSITCMPRPSSIDSCTGNGAGKECVWFIELPSADALDNILANA